MKAAENVQRPTSNAQRPTSPPVVLTIAGSDSSAGAGIQADLKTFGALGVYGLTAVTCVISEIPGKVSRIEPVSVEVVRDQIEVVANSFPIGAIKTGLLCSVDIVRTVARAVNDLPPVPVVVDPVFIATTGDELLEPEAIEAYEKELFPLAALITPNLDEAGRLLGEKIDSRESMERAGRALLAKYNTNILLKGGHLPGESATDLLFTAKGIKEFNAPFVRDIATHGTGCTYSAAITASLAGGRALEPAVAFAKKFVTTAIKRHFRWKKSLHALNHSVEEL